MRHEIGQPRRGLVPWAYETGRRIKLLWSVYWPEMLGGLLGGILVMALGCGRGGQCKPPQRAQSESSPSPTACQEPRK